MLWPPPTILFGFTVFDAIIVLFTFFDGLFDFELGSVLLF